MRFLIGRKKRGLYIDHCFKVFFIVVLIYASAGICMFPVSIVDGDKDVSGDFACKDMDESQKTLFDRVKDPNVNLLSFKVELELYIRNYGSDVLFKDEYGMSLLHVCVEHNRHDLIDAFLYLGKWGDLWRLQVDEASGLYSGLTALQLAETKKCKKCARC